MFRCKSRNTFIGKFIARCTYSISDREDTRVKDTDDISRVCFFHNVPILCHHLLWLGQTHFFIALYMINLHSGIKFTGADTHECDSVSVGFVHIGLNLEDKCRKIFRHRIDHTTVCRSWQR